MCGVVGAATRSGKDRLSEGPCEATRFCWGACCATPSCHVHAFADQDVDPGRSQGKNNRRAKRRCAANTEGHSEQPTEDLGHGSCAKEVRRDDEQL